MASANVDLVRSIFAGWERGDFDSVEWADPGIEVEIAGGPEGGVRWTGLAELAEGWRSFLSTWEEYRVDAEEYRELDAERVLVLLRAVGRGRTSGLELEQFANDGANVFWIRDGKVTRLVAYFQRGRALADLGLAT